MTLREIEDMLEGFFNGEQAFTPARRACGDLFLGLSAVDSQATDAGGIIVAISGGRAVVSLTELARRIHERMP